MNMLKSWEVIMGSILILGFIFEAIALVVLVRIVTQNVNEDGIGIKERQTHEGFLMQIVHEHLRS